MASILSEEQRDENSICYAIEHGDVESLRRRWYAKIYPIHQQMLRAIGELGPLVSEPQQIILKKIAEAERTIASYDMFVAFAHISYTQFSKEVRSGFRHLFNAIGALEDSASANGQAGMVEIVKRLNGLACDAADTDCFRLLLNGYVMNCGAGANASGDRPAAD